MDTSKIIKQYVVWENDDSKVTIVLRSEYYSKSFDYYLTLFNEAKKDFPDLDPVDVKCMQYQGDTHKGQRGIEFNIDVPCEIPDGYNKGVSLIPGS